MVKNLDYNENGNYSSYISQTYMAHARINRWFQNHMRDIIGLNEFSNDEPFEFDRSISFKKQSKIFLQKWLSTRGISLKICGKQLNMKQMRVLILRFKKNPNEIQQYIQESSKLPSGLILEKGIVYMNAMIARIMSPELSDSPNPYLEIQSLIKLFLSIMKDIDIKIDKKKKTGNIVTRSYCFQCLLNIPDDELKFGKMRNIWEGVTKVKDRLNI